MSVKISYANLKDGAYTLKYSDLKLTKDIGYIFGGFYSDAECKTGISNVTVDPTGAKRYVTVYAEVCEAIAGISYISNGDGYAISRYNGYATVVNLPTHYNNLEVNAITGSGTLGAFMYKSVEAVIFAENNNIERIGSNAFAGCNNLTKIVIADGVTQIDEYAFAMCENLETVVISDTVTKMGEKVFYECKSLSAIYCESAEASLGWDAKWNVIYDDGTKVSAVYFGGSWEYDSNGNPKKKA